MVRRCTGIALTILLAIALAACSSAREPSSPDVAGPFEIRVSGSGTAMPLVRFLCERYPGEGISFTYLPGLHSSGAIEGVLGGDLEIGAVSRDLTPEEAALGLQYTRLSDDGLVIAVNRSVPLEDLTTQQVRDIYSGRYTNWLELGGPDLPIAVLDRNEDESAKIAFRKGVLGTDMAITDRAIRLFYEPDMIQGVTSTAGAVGYFSLGFALSERVPVRLVALDGVYPSVDSVEAGDYRAFRPLGIVTPADNDPETSAFIEWATSDEARALIRERGFAAPR
jgi:phosphate transport system substrate-binding protein